MSELEIKGKIIKIGEVQTFNSGFKKIEFVVKTDDKYPQEIKFEIFKDGCEKFKDYNKLGDIVSVKFNIKGNEWENKHYVSLIAWNVSKIKETENTTKNVPEIIDGNPEYFENQNDELPF